PMCPNCDISLTYHKSNSSLLCHYCGYELAVSRQCDNCSGTDVTFRGTGTEKEEEILSDMFGSDVVWMDNDSTSRKGMNGKLLTYVSGRAGRHELSGEVIFQTYNPSHYAIELARHNDYRTFYEKEMAFRRMARYSPFYFHVLFTISSEDVRKCLDATSHIHETL